jgi:hypothetical protein
MKRPSYHLQVKQSLAFHNAPGQRLEQPSGFMRLPSELIDFPHPIVLLPAVE